MEDDAEAPLGPSVSLSSSNKTLTGTASDNASGVNGYAFANTTTSFTSVAAQTGSRSWTSTANSSGTYYFSARDLANNTATTSRSVTVYAYHCNFCGQDTNSIHYNCPTHYSSQSCSTSRTRCATQVNSGTKVCGKTLSFTIGVIWPANTGVHCSRCDRTDQITWEKAGTPPTCSCGKFYKQLCSSCLGISDERIHGGETVSFKCNNQITVISDCGKTYTTNYRTY